MVDFHGLPAVQLTAPAGARAIITLHGAQLVSWQPAGGDERLYLSERSAFTAGQPIRGGVPVIFPQFAGFGSGPRHGFGRTEAWRFTERRAGNDFDCATLRLEASEATRALWPHDFGAELTVSIGANRLDIELEVENADCRDFTFAAALHTYLRVREVETARLEGLQGRRYRDQLAGGKEQVDRAEALVVADEVDRIYVDPPSTLVLLEHRRSLLIESDNFPDLVVWNPWETKAAALPDMPPMGFRRFLCVEPAAVAQPVRLEPGKAWWGRQTLVAA